MAFDYSKIQSVLDEINSTYTGWKSEPQNALAYDKYSSQNTIETITSPMYASIIQYLYTNHNSKKFLELDMGLGLLKFHNDDSGSNLSIKSACWQREWHSVNLSNTSEINQKSDEFRGLLNIKLKSSLGVQADYVMNVSSELNNGGDYDIPILSTLNVRQWDNTSINLNDFDMLLIRQPQKTIFNNVSGFKTAISYSGSILFYDVGGLYEAEDLSSYTDNIESSSTTGKDLRGILGPPQVCDVSSLPTHTELQFSTTRGFLIP